MNHSLKENLITTKDASELSGYTSDYLARLVRSGEIQGKRIGHSWVISSASLETFMTKQKGRKLDRARELASSRVREYNKHNQFVQRTTRALTEKISVPKFRLEEVSLRSHSLALGVALVVVALGAVGANAAALPQVAQRASALATEISSGFVDTFGDVPTRIAVRMEEARIAVRADATRNALASRRVGYVASPVLASIDLETLRTVLVKEYRAPRATSDIAFSSARTDTPILTVTDVYASAASAYTFFANPSNIGTTLTDAYFAIGTDAYAAVDAAFSVYRALIDASGMPMLAVAATTRDALAHTPRLVAQVNLALGEAVINATRAAIRTDVIAAHGLAAAAPESARIAVTLMGSAGDTLARAVEQVPARVATAYLNATAVPAVLAPRLAQTVFNAEYAVADRFVSATNAVSGRYLALVEGTGDIAYESSTNARSIVQSASRTIAFAPAALEDVTLGTLGKSAAALDSVTHLSLFAAVLPALSASEKTALAVYEAIHSAFDSANRTLVAFFTTTPETVLPTGVPKARVIAVATSTRPVSSGTQPVTTLSYPTYTTVVRGVSEDFVNQSLASLRTNVLATVAGMIQPVSSQVVQNITTIQQLNRIDSLHDLVVQNGDFRNSIFDNGIRVNARDGYFDNLTAGTTTLATTTVNGTLTISSLTLTGSLSSPGSITGSHFVSTSTNATSTFAGSINIDNAGFVYATSTRNVGIGVLSPAALLAVQNSTSTQPIFVASNAAGAEVYRLTNDGFVGIGTTSPTYNLAVEGSSTLGNQAIAGYFTATTTTATSTFAGSFTVGTDKLVVNSTTGNIGIGTTSPYQRLSVAGNVIADTFIATSTAGTSTFAGALAVSGLSSFTLASTSRLSVFDYAWFGGSATSTFTSNGYLGILSAAPAYPLDVTGIGRFSSLVDASHFVATSTSATSTFAGGLAVGTSRLLVDSTTGRVGIGTTSPSGTLAVAGDFFLTGSTTITGADSGIVFTGSGNHDITALGGTLRIGTNTIIGNIEALNDTVDIGTAVTRFDKIYANEVNASTIVGTLTGGNLSAETFTINSDNATADTENAYLAFERGTTGPNAVLTWNAAESAKRFELNHPLFIQNASASTTLTTLDLKSVAGQIADIFRVASSSSDTLFNVTSSGNVGIGTTTPSTTLAVQGNGLFSGNLTAANITATGTLSVAGALSVTGNVTQTGGAIIAQNGAITGNGALLIGADVSASTLTDATRKIGVVSTPHYTNAQSKMLDFWSDSDATTNTITIGGGLAGFHAATNVNIYAAATNTGGAGASVAAFTSAGAAITGTLSATATTTSTGGIVGPNNFVVQQTSGNVGIGTATPGAKLDIRGSIQQYVDASTNYITTQRASGIIGFLGNSSDYFLNYDTANQRIGIGDVVAPGSKLSVGGNASIGSGYKATTAPANGLIVEGNVGIGTTDPGAFKLNVAGQTKITSTSEQLRGYYDGSRFASFSARSNGDVQIYGWTGAAYTNILLGVDGATTSAGNVGVGTTSPAYKLSVEGSSTLGNQAVAGYFTATTSTATSTFAGGLAVGTSKLVVDSTTGNVGIGTTNPASKLTVASPDAVTSWDSTSPLMTISNLDQNGTHSWALLVKGGANNAATKIFDVQDYSGTSHLTVMGTGNVGIGTTSPDGKLHVYTSTAGDVAPVTSADDLIVESGGQTGITLLSPDASPASIAFGSPTDSFGALLQWTHDLDLFTIGTQNTGGDIALVTGNNAEAMRILDNGNVGIGTTSPYTTLAVSAASPIGLIQSTGGVATLAVRSPNSSQMILDRGSTSLASLILLQTAGSNNWAIGNGVGRSTTDLQFWNYAGAEAMTIQSTTSNVGIGTTTPWGKLSVTNTGTGPSFVVEDATSPDTTPFVIDASGNVGVGIASPSHKLQVVGSNNATEIKVSSADQGSGAILFGDGASALKNVGIWRGNANSYAVNGNWMNFGTYGDGGFVWATGNAELGSQTERMRLSAATGLVTIAQNLTVSGTGDTTIAGNVGIGTVVPGTQLDVASAAAVNGQLILRNSGTYHTGFTAVATLGAASTDTAGWSLFGGPNSYVSKLANRVALILPTGVPDFSIVTGNTNALDNLGTAKFTVTQAGNVGIGTTTPGSLLDIYGSSGPMLRLIDGGTAGTNADPHMTFRDGTSQMGAVGYTTSNSNNLFVTNSISGGHIILSPTGAGNVGIGTTTPFFKLQVAGGSASAQIGISDTDSGVDGKHWTIQSLNSSGNAQLRFRAINDSLSSGINALVISRSGVSSVTSYFENGNVGIGTTSPANKLDVYAATTGGINIDAAAGYNPYLRLRSYSSANSWYLEQFTGGAFTINLDSTASDASKLVITTAGNVGIGTTDPNVKTTIESSTNQLNVRATGKTWGLLVSAGVNYTGSADGVALINVNAGPLSLGTSNSVDMTIDSAGNVGIGTTSPVGVLSVSGTAAQALVLGSSNGTRQYITWDPQGIGSRWNLGHGIGGIATNDFGLVDADLNRVIIGVDDGARANALTIRNANAPGTVGIGTTTPWGNLSVTGLGTGTGYTFVTANSANTPTFVVQDNGNVGIGTTTPHYKLDVQGPNGVSSFTGSVPLGLMVRGATDTGSGYYSGIDFGGMEGSNNINPVARIASLAVGTGSSLLFGTSAGYASGITNTAMVINNVGNVGIGTTSPFSRLSVTGAGTGTGRGFSVADSSNVDNFYVLDNGNAYMKGNVGIGTTSPVAKLGVDATGANSTTNYGVMSLLNGGANSINIAGYFSATNASQNFALKTVGANDFGGNITTSGTIYSASLHSSTIGNLFIGDITSGFIAGNGGNVVFAGDTVGQGSANTTFANIRGIKESGTYDTSLGALVFGTQSNSGSVQGLSTVTEKMRITSSGNVGIGTTDPNVKTTIESSTNQLNVRATGKTWGLLVSAGVNYTGSADGVALINVNAGPLSLGTSNSVDMTIDSAGNVGIGTTTPGATLHVYNGSFIVGTQPLGTSLSYGFQVPANGNAFTEAAVNAQGKKTAIFANPQSSSQVGTFFTYPGASGGLGGLMTDGPLVLGSNSAERVRIDNSGNVGIGTTSPFSRLSVTGAGTGTGRGFSVADSSNVDNFYVLDNGNAYMKGNVGIGTTSPATKLEVGGNTANVTFDGYLNCAGFTSDANGKLACTASDQRLKQSITSLATSSVLTGINALNPVSFIWRDPSMGSQQQFGLIAQQVQEVFPNLVQMTNPTELTPDGTLTVNYPGFISPMILAIQELDARTRQILGSGGVLSIAPGVESQCVTGDTRLRRRRRRADGSFELDEVDIKGITAGDEIQSLDERTGRVVYSRVNALMDMGEQEVYELVTKSGRRIRTTANHPYLARERATNP